MPPPENEQDPYIGRGIGSSYAVVRRIGAGGMGAVYEARHRNTGRRVAIKVLNREMAQDPSLLERFRREARITSSLKSPHVVKVLEFDQLPDGVPYMVMEYLEGEDLESRLKRVKQLGPNEALELVRGASAALSEAHAAGVVHRDIKPGNLFYAREGTGERVKLLDFGISKATNLTGAGLTVFGQVLGTIWYMSPEQARGGELTAASDVYSLGVVLFEALSGQLPFEASTPIEYLVKIQSEPARPLHSVAPSLPLALEGVFARALAQEPSQRTSSVAAFAHEIEDTFTMGSEATAVRRVSDPALRAPPPLAPPRRASTSGKVPVPRATSERLKSGIRPPVAWDDDMGSTEVARHQTPATPMEARSAVEPTTLDEEAPPDRSAPPVADAMGDATVGPFTAPSLDFADPLDEEGATKVMAAPNDEGATRVEPAPRRPDTMPTPREAMDQGPTVMNLKPLEEEVVPRRASSGLMRARPAARGSERDPEAGRFTPPMGVPQLEGSELPTTQFDADGGPGSDPDDAPTGKEMAKARPPAVTTPIPSGNGKTIALGITLGLGLLVVVGALVLLLTHH